jgi:hypothetical protein
MATLIEKYKLLHGDGDLWRKCEAAAWQASTDIINESPSTPNHAARLEWANTVRGDPPSVASVTAWVTANRMKILENATLQSAGNASTDNDVQFVINSLAPAAV